MSRALEAGVRDDAIIAFLLFCLKSNNANERCTEDGPDGERPGR
jgi:hypothetical protein